MPARKHRQRRPRLGALLGCAAVLAGGPARADPSKEECFDANESAQTLRASGRLREAEDKLGLCASRACPGPVRKDCTERLDEVQKAMPTVVFAVRSARGDDMTSVRVRMDGALLPATLGGGATAVDPGLHEFTFEADGFAALKEQVLVREADKGRSVSVVMQPAEQPALTEGASLAPYAAAPAPARSGDGSTRRWIAIAAGGIGIVGVGVGGGLALVAKAQFDTAERETGTPRHTGSVSAVDTGNVATVVMSVGGLLAVGGAVLWLTAPSPSVQVGASASEVFLRGTFR